ncbi:MAG TPA: SRPBCC family protein [Gemmatimonadaceae bacterium]|nr:SRPBCC family protein [Gemmatimonadaceae bacterium]
MIKQLLLVVLAIVALIAIRASFVAPTFRVARSTTIKAPPEKVFTLINDFRNFGSWSPWEHLDPAMQRSITGPANGGPGAVYEWSGNSKAGQGRMEILESSAPRHVKIKLDFLRPFRSSNMADYTIEPEGDGTKVTWAMYGPSPFPSKVMQVFISMDDMLGKDFDKGLAALKTLAEKS